MTNTYHYRRRRCGSAALIVAVAACQASANAQLIDVLEDDRYVIKRVDSTSTRVEPDEFLGPFNDEAQISTVGATALFGTGRASSLSGESTSLVESVYRVRFRPRVPINLDLTGTLFVSSNTANGTARARLFGVPGVYDQILSGGPGVSDATLDDSFVLRCDRTYTLDVRSSAAPINDDAIASWLVDARLTSDLARDSDGDGIPDIDDNCMFLANPTQFDADGDGYGNRCDIDFNGDGIHAIIDLGIFRTVYFTDNAEADINEDGFVNVIDLGLFRRLYFQAPGPSGPNNCAGAAD